MAPKHPNPGLRVVGSSSGQETSPEREKLAETPFSGKARLRELEQLAKTARRVRDDAEMELADSRTSRAIAEQRISTCERTIRKAEEEMAELRAELYHSENLDSDGNDYKSAEDFELAVLLGKAARDEEPTEKDIAALELNPLPKPEQRRRPQRGKPAPFRSIPRDSHNPKSAKTRRIGFMLLIATGALIGASLTYTALKSPSIQENVKAIAADPGQLIKQVTKAVTESTAAPTMQTKASETPSSAPVPPAAPAPENVIEPLNTAPPAKAEPAPPQTSTQQPDIFAQRAIEEQRARVIKEAGADFESRISNPTTASTDTTPAAQTTAGDIASSLQVIPDPGQSAGPPPVK